MAARLSFSLLLLLSFLPAKEAFPSDSLAEQIKALPGVEVKALKPRKPFVQAFEILLSQPVDHQKKEGAAFKQRLYLFHRDPQQPVVLNTEGYAAGRNSISELSRLLRANQITVEHRYFGKSKPSPLDWTFLTVKQAADDHHRIRTLFQKIYKGKWIATGISKGGQTALYYRYHYPGDVAVTVPYVAPINLAAEEPRIDKFLETVGDETTRNRIRRFQKLALQNKAELLPMFKDYSVKKNYVYSIGDEKAFVYAVLEYAFSFWQWGNSRSEDIPGEGASKQALFDHLKKVVPFYYFSDKGKEDLGPFFYQAYTEIGYYGYDASPFEGLLNGSSRYSNVLFVPDGAKVTYDPSKMRDVSRWLRDKGNNIIYIYGELDPWSASAANPGPKTNALKIVKKGGFHNTRISNLPEEQRTLVLATLAKWLEMPAAAVQGKGKKEEEKEASGEPYGKMLVFRGISPFSSSGKTTSSGIFH